MLFLKALHSGIFICIRKPTTWIGFFLFVGFIFILSITKAIPHFQEFKDDLNSSDNLKLLVIVDPKSIKSGDRFVLHVKVEVTEGWHIYSLGAIGGEEESLATKIVLSSDLFIPQGSWAEPTPTIGWDGALERIVKTHQRVVEFRRWYRLAESLAPGSHRIKGSIVFRACNNKICNLPREVFFGTEIKVLDGSS